MRKSEEERKEDEELAREVNRTLAEEKREEDEEKKRNEKKKETKTQDERKVNEDVKGKDKDEACPPLNFTCPTVEPCPEVQDCPDCPSVRCNPCPETKDCVPCPEERTCPPCEDCGPCSPCGPCPRLNRTSTPDVRGCPESGGLPTLVAMVIGAIISLVATGIAAVVGLLLRYVPPIVSGFLFLAIILMVWFFSSRYPATAREIGGRVVVTLREAAIALGHRVVEAIQRHNEQVGFPVLVLFFLLSDLSSKFFKSFALRFSI